VAGDARAHSTAASPSSAFASARNSAPGWTRYRGPSAYVFRPSDVSSGRGGAGSAAALAPALYSYNRFRRHRALGGLTPLQRVINLSGTNT
jgi:hypothetical protein